MRPFVVICVALGFSIVFFLSGFSIPIERVDSFPYWSATRFFLEGGNPYSPIDLLNYQRQFVNEHGASRVWNPPILFFCFYPLSTIPLKTFGISIFCLNIIGISLLWLISISLFNIEKIFNLLAFSIILVNPATIAVLNNGQISLFIWLALMLGVLFFKKENYIFSALLLSFVIIKPNTCVFVLFALALLGLKKKLWGFIVAGLAALFVIGLLPEAAQPGIWQNWVMMDEPPYHLVPTSLVGVLGTFISTSLERLLFTLGIITLGFGIITYTIKDKKDFFYFLPFLLGLSSVFAPYGHIFDHFGIPIMQLSLLSQKKLPKVKLGISLVINVLGCLSCFLWYADYHISWYFVLATLVMLPLEKLGYRKTPNTN